MRLVRQEGTNDCGAAVVTMLHNHFHKNKIDLADVTAQFPTLQNGTTISDLEAVSSTFGVTVEGYAGELKDLLFTLKRQPAVMLLKKDGLSHYLVVEQHKKKFRIYDPAAGVRLVEDLSPLFSGVYLKVGKAAVREVPTVQLGENFKLAIPYLLSCLALNALSVSAAIVGGRYFQLVIEQAINTQSVANLVSLSGTFLLVYVLHSLSGALQGLIRNRHLSRLYYAQMCSLHHRLSLKRHSFFTKVSQAELLGLDQYCLTWNAHYVLGFTDMLGDIMVLIGATIAIATIDYRFLLIGLAAVSIQLAVALVEWSWKKGRTSRAKQLADEYKGTTLSLISSKTQAFDFDQAQRLLYELKQNLHEQTIVFKNNAVFEQGAGFVRSLGQHLSFTAAIVIGSLLIMTQGLSSVAQITYFLAMTALLKEAAGGSFGWLVNIPAARQANGVLKKVHAADQLRETNESNLELPSLVKTIELSGVEFSYGSRKVFDNLFLNLASGTLISGRSGSGKSTLARLIAGDSVPSEGSVRFIGNAEESSPSMPLDRVVIVTHEPVFDQLSLARVQNSPDRLCQLIITAMGLQNRSLLADSLSAGQRQVLKVLECLSVENKVLVFDEALSNVDPLLKHLVFQTAVQRIKAHNCVLWISHDHELQSHFEQHVQLGVRNE